MSFHFLIFVLTGQSLLKFFEFKSDLRHSILLRCVWHAISIDPFLSEVFSFFEDKNLVSMQRIKDKFETCLGM